MSGPPAPALPAELETILRRMRLPYLRKAAPDVLATARAQRWDAEILAAAASIAGVESRHAAILADLTGGNPFPAPFEDNKTMEQVLELAGQFIQQ